MRIPVDRLWPRGLAKKDAKGDVRIKAIAPSDDLRKWYNHDRDKWPEFKKRYCSDLDAKSDAADELLSRLKDDSVSLLYSSKEHKYNNAEALKDHITKVSTSHHDQ